MLKKSLLMAALAMSASSAYAGGFVTLTNGDGTNLTVANGGLPTGTNNQNTDPFFVNVTNISFLTGYDDTTPLQDGGTGNEVPTSITYQTFSTTGTHPVTGGGTLSLLDWHKTDNVPILPGIPQATVYDFVFRDSSDNSLVFGYRYENLVDNDQEINYVYRNFFTGYSAAAAWTYATDADLRLYQAGFTSDHTYNASVPYNADSVRLKGDYSVSEGNPASGFVFVKTNATAYQFVDGALGFYQAGQENQTVAGSTIAGFAPAAVPEANTTGMLLSGLGMIGFIMGRRRKQV